MKKQVFMTTSSAASTDNVSIDDNPFTSASRDFLLLCKNENIAEAVHALYYLPLNYKLMIITNMTNSPEENAGWLNTTSLQGRISFDTDVSKIEQSSYESFDAIISNDHDIESDQKIDAPYVVVSSTADTGITVNGANGLTVQRGNPEALASAILQLARKR